MSSGAAKKKKKKARSTKVASASLDKTGDPIKSVNEEPSSTTVSHHALTSVYKKVEESDTAAQDSQGESSFESELAWCLSQLQFCMTRSQGNNHHRTKCEKNFKTLSSSKTPLPRKRQLMRSLFGDYRAKMKLDPVAPLPSSQPGIGPVVNERDLGSKYYRSSLLKNKEVASVQAARSTGFEDDTNYAVATELFQFDFEITSDMMRD